MKKKVCRFCGRILTGDVHIDEEEEKYISIEDWDNDNNCCLDCTSEGLPFM